MWNRQTTLDNVSIGIEVVGFHDQDITRAQYTALRQLLRQLKKIYRIKDKNILTHSMVAYGRPNIFHPRKHRGRKKCGMIFSHPDVRKRLGLLPDLKEIRTLPRPDRCCDPDLPVFSTNPECWRL
jgi:hypothetical protein